jgi:hypothetical protein
LNYFASCAMFQNTRDRPLLGGLFPPHQPTMDRLAAAREDGSQRWLLSVPQQPSFPIPSGRRHIRHATRARAEAESVLPCLSHSRREKPQCGECAPDRGWALHAGGFRFFFFFFPFSFLFSRFTWPLPFLLGPLDAFRYPRGKDRKRETDQGSPLPCLALGDQKNMAARPIGWTWFRHGPFCCRALAAWLGSWSQGSSEFGMRACCRGRREGGGGPTRGRQRRLSARALVPNIHM